MGLPARQRRMLGRIEAALGGSDPRLAALYAIFARLTRDEEMPRIENLRHGAARVLARARFWLAGLGTAIAGRLIPRQRSALLLPVALGLAVASVVFAVTSSSGPNCTPVTSLASTSAHAHGSKLCNHDDQPPMGLYLGH
jgi:Protein of unknown function (DUF3040)